MKHCIDQSSLSQRTTTAIRPLRWLLAGLASIALTLWVYYNYWPRSPANLAEADNMISTQVLDFWTRGEMIVLVRHGERCDSSSNPCLGPSDGITVVGSSVSKAVGQWFARLGLDSTDVLASPTTRTVQTAQAMFGPGTNAQHWLHDCDQTLIDQAITHKKDQRNLVLVTHSGCISQIETLHGYPRAPKSEYASALFVAIDGDGTATLRGLLNPEDWPKLPALLD
ncbi:histidine phosphatase family protein [Pseudomonas sp. S75]|uniref:lipopolysaccharide core heptose(II)-phosphate phosphatase PmrG n=1 Tax=unclassified Pseudomonas TaxID=196821 RepID=UPI0019088A86|nr:MULTISPECIES: histidine phosphatase family protein [unclassified Pseudomonas]MBJ9973972.1 histidine phosphatase family protein [Pseudomonas sp. S30]MBK0152098.1 histidine phosphatase family protein [Pseudomonas sp. S75]